MNTLSNPTQLELIEAFKTLGKTGYILNINEDALTASLDRVAPKSIIGYKNVFCYRFKNIDRIIEYCTKFYNELIISDQKKIQLKEEAKIRKEKELSTIEVGDVFCYSWGYEQTQCEFFQIVERKGKTSAIIRPISHIVVEETGWASQSIKPAKDEFIGDSEKIRLSGNYFKRSCGYAYKTNLEDSHHTSWYA